jgi:hypothetical protein
LWLWFWFRMRLWWSHPISCCPGIQITMPPAHRKGEINNMVLIFNIWWTIVNTPEVPPYHEEAGGSVDLPELLFGGESLGWLVVFCTQQGQLMQYVSQHIRNDQQFNLDWKWKAWWKLTKQHVFQWILNFGIKNIQVFHSWLYAWPIPLHCKRNHQLEEAIQCLHVFVKH